MDDPLGVSATALPINPTSAPAVFDEIKSTIISPSKWPACFISLLQVVNLFVPSLIPSLSLLATLPLLLLRLRLIEAFPLQQATDTVFNNPERNEAGSFGNGSRLSFYFWTREVQLLLSNIAIVIFMCLWHYLWKHLHFSHSSNHVPAYIRYGGYKGIARHRYEPVTPVWSKYASVRTYTEARTAIPREYYRVRKQAR